MQETERAELTSPEDQVVHGKEQWPYYLRIKILHVVANTSGSIPSHPLLAFSKYSICLQSGCLPFRFPPGSSEMSLASLVGYLQSKAPALA